jgi:hypothetical protein
VSDSETIQEYTTHYSEDHYDTTTNVKKRSDGTIPFRLHTNTVLSVTTNSDQYWYSVDVESTVTQITQDAAQNLLKTKQIMNQENVELQFENFDKNTQNNILSELKKYWIDSEYMSAVPYSENSPFWVPIDNDQVQVDDIVSGHSGDSIKKVFGDGTSRSYSCLVRSADSFDVSKISENYVLKFDRDTFFFVEQIQPHAVQLTQLDGYQLSQINKERKKLPNTDASAYYVSKVIKDVDGADKVGYKYFSKL